MADKPENNKPAEGTTPAADATEPAAAPVVTTEQLLAALRALPEGALNEILGAAQAQEQPVTKEAAKAGVKIESHHDKATGTYTAVVTAG